MRNFLGLLLDFLVITVSVLAVRPYMLELCLFCSQPSDAFGSGRGFGRGMGGRMMAGRGFGDSP